MLKRLISLILLILIVIFAGSLYLSNYKIEISRYDIHDAGIPASFNGLRIAQISDLHGRNINKKILRAIKRVKPHIIVITGDLLDSEEQWPSVSELLYGLVRENPVYYVTGNHEWAHFDTEDLLDRIQACGVTVLRNEYVKLNIGVESIILAGIDDPNGYADKKTPAELAADIKNEAGESFKVLLAHRPDKFETYSKLGYDLVLSGHIHGGLIRLPFLGGLFCPGTGMFPEYSGGVYIHNQGTADTSELVVSRGLSGVFGIPRLFNRLDLPLITIKN